MKSSEIQEIAIAEAAEAKQVEELVSAKDIKSFNDLRTVVQWIAEIKNKNKEVDEKRTSITKPIRQGLDEVNELFKPALNFLSIAEKSAKSRIISFISQCKIKQEELLQNFDMDASPEKKDAIVKQAEALDVPKIPGLSIREPWTGEIIDPVALFNWAFQNNPQALKVNEKVLVEITKATDGDPKIPGWRSFKKQTVVISPSKA